MVRWLHTGHQPTRNHQYHCPTRQHYVCHTCSNPSCHLSHRIRCHLCNFHCDLLFQRSQEEHSLCNFVGLESSRNHSGVSPFHRFSSNSSDTACLVLVPSTQVTSLSQDTWILIWDLCTYSHCWVHHTNCSMTPYGSLTTSESEQEGENWYVDYVIIY